MKIGLLFVNYEIVLRGYKTIYLGQTMPIESLVELQAYYENLHFLSYFTVVPTKDRLSKYIKDFTRKLNTKKEANLWILGQQTQYLTKADLPSFVRTFKSIDEVFQAL